MGDLEQVPAWFGAAVIGAVLAALGFVGRLISTTLIDARNARADRNARLAKLDGLLSASFAVFASQNLQVQRLSSLLAERTGGRVERGYERQFQDAFDSMTDEEREMHAVIRGTTINGMKPLNDALLSWVQAESYFRTGGTVSRRELARGLLELEVHLLVWTAKYHAWIPDRPDHCLVYLADESEHGPPFPTWLQGLVAEMAGTAWRNDEPGVYYKPQR